MLWATSRPGRPRLLCPVQGWRIVHGRAFIWVGLSLSLQFGLLHSRPLPLSHWGLWCNTEVECPLTRARMIHFGEHAEAVNVRHNLLVVSMRGIWLNCRSFPGAETMISILDIRLTLPGKVSLSSNVSLMTNRERH